MADCVGDVDGDSVCFVAVAEPLAALVLRRAEATVSALAAQAQVCEAPEPYCGGKTHRVGGCNDYT